MNKLVVSVFLILYQSVVFSLNKIEAQTTESSQKSIIKNTEDGELNSSEIIVSSNLTCEDNSPCSLVKNTSIKVLEHLNNKDLSNKNKTMSLIKGTITPNFDFTLMTRYAMGKNWESATVQQQQKLVNSFQELLIYTYSSALYKFRGAKIKIISETKTEKKAEVITTVLLPIQIKQDNTKPIKVEYDLVKTNNNWKAYDIKIEDISLVTTYRNQFNDIVQSGKINGLIEQLKLKVSNLEKNK